jgi:uncharacterized YigZ family protein
MDDTFLTLKTNSEGLYKEKGSKFLSFAIPISNLSEIKEILSDKKKEFHDARHICYAYILGADGKESRANDDGEPSGTAGRPIQGVLLSNNLTNVLIIVVRYFGGTKLGTSGLIQAYKEAAADAVSNNTIIEKTIDETFSIRFEYPFLNDIMHIIKEETPDVLTQHFDMDCFMTLRIRQRDIKKLLSRLEKVESCIILDSEKEADR